MNNFFLFFLFFNLLLYVSTLIPLWNFQNASYNLLNPENNYNYSFIIYKTSIHMYDISLIKTITKSGDDAVNDINRLEIIDNNNDEHYYFQVDWEDINNIIYYNNILHICPKGKYHPLYFNEVNKTLTNYYMYNFPEKAVDWDLKCNINNDLFIAIYPNNYFLYVYNKYLKGWNQINFYFALHDLMWNQIKSKDNLYEVPGLIINNINNIDLTKLYFIIDFSIGFGADSSKTLGYSKNNIKAYFSGKNNYYFITYDIDIDSKQINLAYYNESLQITVDNIINSSTNPKINLFNFDDNIKIKSLDIIKGSRYFYYEIINNNKKYFGIIDILTNKLLFNTDEAIIKFIPYSAFSMLAITKNSAYEICALSIEGKCVEKCDNNNIIINFEGNNYCECPVFYFKPSYKCVDSCDPNFYIKESNFCGLCKDLGGNKIYKLINTKGCLEEMPNNTIFYDQDKLLLTCDNQSHLENETCILNSKDEESEEVKEEEKEEQIDYIILIFIFVILIAFVTISILIFIKLCRINRKKENDLLNQIDTDFEPKNNSII